MGTLAVFYARLVSYFQGIYFIYFKENPIVVCLSGPLLFLLATWLVQRFGPDAKGSGIPQVLAAIHQSALGPEEQVWKSPLISIRTAIVKVFSSVLGILGGASIGREGPTVQIAASGFAFIGRQVRKVVPHVDIRSFLIAGAAAGVAAAFNTPIAGIVFAIEEIATNTFSSFKQTVLVAIIIAGLFAQYLSGDYLYFGQPQVIVVDIGLQIGESIAIGIAGGILGAFFALVLSKPQIARMPKNWMIRATVAGIACSVIGYLTSGATSGSGYEVTEHILSHGTIQDVSIGFPFYKLVTTVLSYLSGMAGGIFSPSLSIGAGLGLAMAKILGWVNFKTCALTGMVAFFSGAVGAPLTSVIIVMEMTNERTLVLPFMIATYVAHLASKKIQPVPLYHYLAQRHLEG